MRIEKTTEIKAGASLVMIVYGQGGVGKTTFAASAPGVLLLDFENGSKYLGQRGLQADVVRFSRWLTPQDKRDLQNALPEYETIVVDPLGEAMEHLLVSDELASKKYRQSDGSLTMAGWGEAKKRMRSFIRWLRNTGKNVIIIAHDTEEKDGDRIVHRIKVATKLREEIPTIVDVISYLGVRMVEGQMVRMLYTPRQGDDFESKDRTGRAPVSVTVSEKTGYADFQAALGPIASPIEDPPVARQPPEDNSPQDGSPDIEALVQKCHRAKTIDELNAIYGDIKARYGQRGDVMRPVIAECISQKSALSVDPVY